MITSGPMRSGNNAVSVVSAASVVGVGGDVGGVGDGSERIHVYDVQVDLSLEKYGDWCRILYLLGVQVPATLNVDHANAKLALTLVNVIA